MSPGPEPTRETDQPDPLVDHSAPPRSVRLLRAALLSEAALLAVAAVGLGASFLVRGPASEAREPGMAAFLVAFALGTAWALWAAARALGAGRRGGRAVAMTWQLFQVVIAGTALTSGSLWPVAAGVVLLVLALAVIALLMFPTVIEATTRT